MGIFDRLKRLARAEISEMKRVLSDKDGPSEGPRDAARRDEDERQRLIREAEEELARAEHDVLAAEIEAGAALWGSGASAPAGQGGAGGDDIARGAALWGAAADEGASGSGATTTTTTAGQAAPAQPAHAAPYESRTHAFPREIRDAYAALELPLGADREAVERAFREQLHRYHPDKHVGDPRREAMAHDLTIRIREARDLLTSWLARGAG